MQWSRVKQIETFYREFFLHFIQIVGKWDHMQEKNAVFPARQHNVDTYVYASTSVCTHARMHACTYEGHAVLELAVIDINNLLKFPNYGNMNLISLDVLDQSSRPCGFCCNLMQH